MTTAVPRTLDDAIAEIARLRRKVLRYRQEIVNLREKLEEPAYNEPESELERMQEMEEEAREAPEVPPPPPVPSPTYFTKLRHRFKREHLVVPLPWPPHPLLLFWSFVGSFAGAFLASEHPLQL